MKQLIKLGLFLSLLTSLIISNSGFFPFIFGKAIFFQVLIEILFIFYIILIFKKPEFRPKLNLLNIAVLVYFLVLGLTTLVSVDIFRSFWSTQERMTGFFNQIHFGMFFLMLSTLFKKKDYIWLLRISLFVSAIMSVYALSHWEARLSSTLGNPGFLACYLLFNIFFAIWLFLEDKRIELNNQYQNFWQKNKYLFLKFGYILIFLLNLIAFYFTHTRGAFVGLFAGLLCFFVFLIFTKSGRDLIGLGWKRWVFGTIFISFLCVSFLGVYTQKERFLSGSKTREVSWEISWNAWQDRFLLGYGPENYIIAFTKHFEAKYAKYGSEWLDKAHCQPFEIAVTTGIVGIIAYFSIFIIAIYNFIRKRNFLFVSLLIAYFITNLFWFDTTSSLIMFYIVIAMSQTYK